METDPKRMCALLVSLPDVTIIGVGDWPAGVAHHGQGRR